MIDLAAVPDVEAMPADELLAYVAELAGDMTATEARIDALRALRVRVYRAARAQQPPITLQRLADAAGVTDVTVNRVLQKAG